jgi:hypothetical protein
VTNVNIPALRASPADAQGGAGPQVQSRSEAPYAHPLG